MDIPGTEKCLVLYFWHPMLVRPVMKRRFCLKAKNGLIIMPVPNTSVSSVQHQYRYRTLRYVRYNIIPAPETSVRSVRHQYWYRTLRLVRYGVNTGTGMRYRYGRLYRSWYGYWYNVDTGNGHFDTFGTTSTRYWTLR